MISSLCILVAAVHAQNNNEGIIRRKNKTAESVAREGCTMEKQDGKERCQGRVHGGKTGRQRALPGKNARWKNKTAESVARDGCTMEKQDGRERCQGRVHKSSPLHVVGAAVVQLIYSLNNIDNTQFACARPHALKI